MAKSHGSGVLERDKLASLGTGVVFEPGAMVFHPETIELGSDVYVGHYAMLKGYYVGRIVIGDHTWIGQYAFLHGAGGLWIGKRVGIGPGVRVLTSAHALAPAGAAIIDNALEFAEVRIEDGADIGANAVLLPGSVVGAGAQIGAGAVVSGVVPPGSVAVGVPARVVRQR